MDKLQALENAAVAFSAFERYANLMMESHKQDVNSFKILSRRRAIKMEKDLTALINNYRDVLNHLMYELSVDEEEYIACCNIFSSIVSGRLTDLQCTHEAYARLVNLVKNDRLKSMTRGKSND